MRLGTSRSRSVFGSSISRISISSPGEGSRVVGTLADAWISKDEAACTSSTVTPGCTDTNCIVCPGPSKSKTPRSLTTRCTWWKRVAAGPAASARVRPTPETMSTCSTKTREECFGTQ